MIRGIVMEFIRESEVIQWKNGEYETIIEGLECKVVTYSHTDPAADYYATNISYNEYGFGQFDLYIKGELYDHYKLSVVGEHNISNALSTLAVAIEQKIDSKCIRQGLQNFRGVDRRFQKKGDINGISIIDDYAHHPSEITATLNAARNYPHNNLWCVFQPHTYTRTRAFLKELAASLSLADKVIVTEIYAAREKDPGDISSKDLYDELIKLGVEAYHISSFEEIKKFILNNCIDGDMLITMGAGNVVDIGEELLQ